MRLEKVRAASGWGFPEAALYGEGGVPARPNLVSPLLQPVYVPDMSKYTIE
jgi:hypothetical protein